MYSILAVLWAGILSRARGQVDSLCNNTCNRDCHKKVHFIDWGTRGEKGCLDSRQPAPAVTAVLFLNGVGHRTGFFLG